MRIKAQETMGTTLGGPSKVSSFSLGKSLLLCVLIDTCFSRSDDSSAEVVIGHAPTLSAPLNPFADIEEEFTRYMAAGINAMNESDMMGIVDLVDYWKIAMNVLPAQASAVSSECVFSSSKKTCTSECSRLSADSMEYLQVLKHSLVHRR
ncbi:hypothetical protein FRC11_002786 [Ceratobasidium sp. 423]|nr:hypothetical protein FRC11_002786 [Ceratobasidium sp. 423]